MKINRYLLIFFYITFNSILLFSQPKDKIVIIYEDTEYKKALIKKLIPELENLNFDITQDDIKNIQNHNPQDYKIVLIISYARYFRPDPQVAYYLNKNFKNKNIIYFCTATKKSFAYEKMIKKETIDVITAASIGSNITNTIEKIIEKIQWMS